MIGIRKWFTAGAATVALAFVAAPAAGSYATFENAQLMNLAGPMSGWGGNATLHGKVDQGAAGVDFDVSLGTIEWGKLSLGHQQNINWAGLDNFYLRVELLSADGASQSIELNPFIQTGGGFTFHEDKDEVVVGVGQSYVLNWDISGIAARNDIRNWGFQLFTGGGVQNPDAMRAVVRVTPIPEPASLSLLVLSGLLLRRGRRQII